MSSRVLGVLLVGVCSASDVLLFPMLVAISLYLLCLDVRFGYAFPFLYAYL